MKSAPALQLNLNAYVHALLRGAYLEVSNVFFLQHGTQFIHTNRENNLARGD